MAFGPCFLICSTFGHRSSTLSSVSDHPDVVELSRNRTIHDTHIPPKHRKPTEYLNMPFSTVVLRIENNKDILSTSFDISFRPPEVLLNLAEHKEQDSTRRVRGKDRCALMTLLDWDSKENTGKGMTGFTRHQCLSVLVSRHIRQGPAVVSYLELPLSHLE